MSKEITLKNFSAISLKKIQDVDVLQERDLDFIKSVGGEIERCNNVSHKWRSKFIIKNAVLSDDNYPLKSSKYWQCVREELVFFNQLLDHSIDYERNRLEKKKLQLRIDKLSNDQMGMVDKELLQLEILEKDIKMVQIKRDAKERIREIRIWESVKDELNDGSFDINDPETDQEKHWVTRWSNDVKRSVDYHNPQKAENANEHLKTWRNENGN